MVCQVALWVRVPRERNELGGSMFKVGDLVWSLTHSIIENEVIIRRLAIIIALDYDDYNPYIIKLVACGREGRTSQKYLEPMG